MPTFPVEVWIGEDGPYDAGSITVEDQEAAQNLVKALTDVVTQHGKKERE